MASTRRRLSSGVRRPKTVRSSASTASSAASSGSSCDPATGPGPAGIPARSATAATVAGASPDSTLTATPWWRRNSTVAAASGRMRSSRTTVPRSANPSGVTPGSGSGSGSETVPNTSVRHPSSAGAAPPPGARTSGAPSTSGRGSPRSRTALHFQRDENGTSASTSAAAPGNPAAIASSVSVREAAPAAYAARSRFTSPLSRPAAGTVRSSTSRPSVSVPVLSRHTVSTLASTSTLFSAWTSIPRRASRTAATAKVRLVRSTRPSGTSVTIPAVAVAAASRKGRSCRTSTHAKAPPSTTIPATRTRSSRLI